MARTPAIAAAERAGIPHSVHAYEHDPKPDVLGGVSPLGQRRRLPTTLDASALAHATVFVSAGRRGLELELDPHDLVRLTDAGVREIARQAMD